MRNLRLLGALLPILLGAATWLAAQPVPPDLLAEMDRARGSLCALYGVAPADCAAPVSVQIVSDGREAEASWPGLPPFAAGAAEPAAGRLVVVRSRCGPYPFGDAAQTLRHEISHVALYRGLGFPPPRWLDEGLAMRASAEWGFRDELFAALALPAVAHGSWHLGRVETDFAGGESQVRRSYALTKGFVRDLFKNDADLHDFLAEARRERSVERAFLFRFGTSPDGAFRAWAKHLPWWGEWVVLLSSPDLLWLVVLALFLVAAFAAWRRRKRKYEALED